jgi:putative flippase GtrA
VYHRLRSHPSAAKVTKYAVGSVLALVTSIVVFALLYVLGVGTTADSILAFVAGAVPNWVLNRRWAWEKTGRVEFVREVIGYVIVSVVALVASSAGTGWTQSWVKDHVAAHHGYRVVLVTGAYVLVQAILFVAKYLIYEHWVFAGRSRFRAALRSRSQALRSRRGVLVAPHAGRAPGRITGRPSHAGHPGHPGQPGRPPERVAAAAQGDRTP